MAGFSAESAVEPLEFDLRPHVDSHGVIPEPSDGQLRAFRRAIIEQAQTLGGEMPTERVDELSEVEAIRVLSSMTPERVEGLDDQIVEITAEVCAGTPSLDDLRALPPRVRTAFYGWLAGMLLGGPGNPTPPSVGTRRSPVLANGGSPST